MRKIFVRLATIMLTLVMVLTAAFAMPETVNAAAKTKTPAKPKFSSVKVSGNDVTLKWKKAKYAKYYRVYVQTGDSEWKYWKKVKKTSANKKKYTNKMKYKVKASGKKYKVYKLVNKYKIAVKKTKKLTYTYHGKPGTKYHFILKAINGKKLSKASLTKTATTPDEVAPFDGDQPGPDDPGDQTDPSEQGPYTITYVLNGGTNDPANPETYTTGTEVRLAAPTKEGSDFWGWYTDASFKNKIEVIPTEQKGNLTLYAKWAREAINVEGEGMEDMIWTWWHYPQILTEGDKTFWGYATKEGYCGIAMFDASTGKTVKTNLKLADTVDDHNGITFTILKDKRIMCIYAGGHNSDNELHVRISDEPLDVSSFSTDILLDSVGKTCYGQIVESRGRYWVFYRINNTSWGCRSSEDGINWSIERVLVKASMQYYCKFVPTTNDGLVRMLMYSNPTENAPEIRMGFLNTRNGYMYNSDAKTLIGSDSLDYKEFDVIQDVEKGKTQRLLDAAVSDPDKPKFLIASFSATKASNDSVYYVCDSGKKIKVCDGGKPLWDPKYQLGATFVGDNMIVAARHENLVDRVELYDYDGSAVSLNRTIFTNQITNSVRSARPIADPTGKVLAWHYGYYNIDKYTDYDTSAILYFIDENMLVGAPEQTEPAQTEYKITYVLNGGTNNEENPATYIPGTYTELKAPVKAGYEFAGWFADSTFQTNISAITEYVSGDLTLYAKWESEAQYVEDAKTTDMIWGSWMSPHAVSDGNKIFWAYSTKEGTAGVAVYNGDTGKISRTTLQYLYENKPKESYTPAITLTDDKRVVVAVSTEPQARKMIRVYVSEKPLDISKFDSIQVPTTRIVSNCQLVKAGGLYYLFYRGENGLWFYKNSEDCTAWSSETVAIMAKKDTSGQYNYFCRFRPTTDSRLIRIVMQAVPGEDIPTDIRMGFLNTADGLIYNADSFTPLGNEKIDYSNFNIIQSADTGKALNLLDVAVTSPNAPKFIYTSFTDEKGKNDSKYILYNAGRKYDICDGGKDLSDPGLQLGAAFLGSDKIAAARSSDGKDIVELYTVSNSAVTFEKEAYSIDSSDGTRTGRPIADQNGKAVIWHQGTYTSGTVFNTAAVLYLTDSETVVGEPELPVEYKITYELNGGTNSTQNPAAYMSGTAVTLRKPSREGYSFEGWFEDAEFSKAFSGITADTTGDITVYAKWEELPPAVQSTITYELNGGTNNVQNPDKYTEGTAVVLRDPSQEGYTFKGWFEDAEFTRAFAGITAQTTGDITVYAKWEKNEIPLTVLEDEDMNDMIWNWWIYPQVISSDGKVIWTYSTKEGTAGVAAYDEGSGDVMSTTLQYLYNSSPNESYTPAVMLTDDNRVMCAVPTQTDAKKKIHVYISDDPLDISSFGTHIEVATSRVASCCQLLRAGGKYYLFYRGEDGFWAYKTSADGMTWSTETIAVMAKKPTSGTYKYCCRFMPTTDDGMIRIVMQAIPGEDIPSDIRMGFLSTSDGWIYDADMVTALGKEKLDYSSFSIMQAADEGKAMRLLDVAVTAPESPRFIYADFTNTSGVTDSVYTLYDSGNTYGICYGGKPLSGVRMHLGASFAGSDAIVAAFNSDDKDIIETFSIGSSGVTPQAQIYEQSTSDGRAAKPVSDASGSSILWYVGSYSSATAFDTSAMLYLESSNTLIKAK